MSAKRTSGAVMTSLIVHGVVFVIAGIYLVTQTQQFRDLVRCRSATSQRTAQTSSSKTGYHTDQANSSNYKYNGC